MSSAFLREWKKLGNEIGASVRGYMFRNTMLREDMHDEYCCKVFRCTVNCRWDENALLGQSVNNHQD